MKARQLAVYVWLFVIAFLTGCGLFGPQKYDCDVSKVESVQIIRLDSYVEGEYRFDNAVLCDVEEYAAFLNQLKNIKHSVNWGEPTDLNEGYVVVKINYLDGDYDLIHCYAQWYNCLTDYQTGYFFFDEEQYNSLISNYVSTVSTMS